MDVSSTFIPGEILSHAELGSPVSPFRREDLFPLRFVLAYPTRFKCRSQSLAAQGATR
jgi:hypothetical protein